MAVYLLVGALAGAAASFVVLRAGELPTLGLRLAALGLGAGIGAALGILLARVQHRAAAPLAVVGEVAADEDDDEGPATQQMIYVATPSLASSSERRLVRIRAHTAPMAPPDLEIRLVLEEFDHAVRIARDNAPALIEGGYRAWCEEAFALATEHQPASVDSQFRLVAFRSEGPLQPDGASPWGWTFHFVHGAIGLGCVVTVSRSAFSVQYQTAPTHLVPATDALPDVARALATTRESIPELAETALWLRCNLPSDLFLYLPDPLCIVDAEPDGSAVRNQSSFRRYLASVLGQPVETFRLEDLLAWAAGEPFESAALRVAVADPVFADGLRTNQPAALLRAGHAVFRAHGPEAIEILTARVRQEPDPNDAQELLELLAYLPSGLATAALHDLHETAPRLQEQAGRLLHKRMQRLLGVTPDPTDRLDFVSARTAMGKTTLPRPLPLRSTYQEETLLQGLAEVGLQVTRRRMIAGEFPIQHGAYLRAVRGDTEALLSSSPLPMPCHVLHLSGSGSESFAQRIERSGLLYNLDEMQADAASASPHRVHRAALYMAALQLQFADAAPSFARVWERGRNDHNMRRALLLALEHDLTPDAASLLEKIAAAPDPGDAETIQEVIARRERREPGRTRAKRPREDLDS